MVLFFHIHFKALGALKKGKTNFKEGKTEAKGRDADDDAKKKGTSRAMKMMYQMDAKEIADKLKEDVSLFMPGLTISMQWFCFVPPVF